ncbi:LysR family transcriptional regulator [Brevibacterium sediminis]|uniref:LysR family transcriptional regulator n=1 Tax=Brevibacterium TaxID=1696 RepID=UPI001555A899|nr:MULTISPECIES: LysR family transcriptional regulator [Brevibacterium]MCS4593129.1 LysR family transcriptional regulator [Brevibacterium sediminis]
MHDLGNMKNWPELQALGLLVALSGNARSIGQAAAKLDLAQPNASRSLRNLERDLKVPLLRRSPRGTELTVEGRAVAEWASNVIEAYDTLYAGARAIQDARAGTVKVSASLTVAEYLMPHHLTTFRAAHPTIDIGLSVENSATVIDRVRRQTCDLGLIESVSLPQDLNAEVVGRDRLMIACAPDFAHAWTKPVTAEELAQVPLLVREIGSGTREVIDSALLGAGGVRVAGEYGSNSALRIAAATSVAPAVLSELALRDDFRAGRLVPLPVADDVDLTRELHAVWARNRRQSPGARLLLEHMIDSLE